MPRYGDLDSLAVKWLLASPEQRKNFGEVIDKHPTVEIKQREGEWIDKPTGAYRRMQSWCSACGKHSGIGGIESNRHKPYCPNCGAKMKGGAE